MTTDLEPVLAILTRAREILAAGVAHNHTYAEGLSETEYADFSRYWMTYYTATYAPPRDPVEEAIALLAETVWDDELPVGISPVVILSNWNEEPERTQDDVLAAYDQTIQRVTETIGVPNGT